ncbi:MAG: hypothetical protein HC802_01200 [Caldilineaceae bacterium]|nr:hypothetical protein [Caldilineaceae bacterium]
MLRYGDQSEVLNFRDLIEVESFRDGQVDVRLRNLEYDLTRAIKKAVFGFQNVESVLTSLPAPARLTLITTEENLPEEIADAPATIEQVAREIEASAPGKFSFVVADPDDPTSPVSRDWLYETYGLQPFMVSPFSDESYFLHLLLEVGDQSQIIFPGELSQADIRSSIESVLKRHSSGFLKVVGLWRPTIGPDPTMAQLGQNQPPPFSTWNTLFDSLSQDYEVRAVDLSSGQIPADLDVLVVVSPQSMSDVERFAIDQFLMRGARWWSLAAAIESPRIRSRVRWHWNPSPMGWPSSWPITAWRSSRPWFSTRRTSLSP